MVVRVVLVDKTVGKWWKVEGLTVADKALVLWWQQRRVLIDPVVAAHRRVEKKLQTEERKRQKVAEVGQTGGKVSDMLWGGGGDGA